MIKLIQLSYIQYYRDLLKYFVKFYFIDLYNYYDNSIIMLIHITHQYR